jgi:alpha-galactosidase
MKNLVIAIAVLSLLGCSSPNNHIQFKGIEQIHSSMLNFSTDSIQIDGDLKGFDVKLSSQTLENGLEVVRVLMTSTSAQTPPKFSLKWKVPSIDIHKIWNPNFGVNKANFYYNSVNSSSTHLAPVISLLNSNDENRMTVAIADALNKTNIQSYIKEEDAMFHFELSFFDERYPAIKEYSTEILIDRREKPFYHSLAKVSQWWAEHKNYKAAPVPEDAMRPMYSTWYSYHQNLNVDAVVEECREGKEMGMKAVIVDDGWQTLDNKRGYAYTGDWKPDRIPDMKGFVDQIHQLNMKFILWYSVPFIGKNAENYPRFKGKYLYYWESQGAWVLDPRYPEVREFIINIYEEAMRDWGLDGFKLDFMGFFHPDKDSKLTAEDGRDFASVNHAVDQLMTDIMSRLRAANPNILIEFRQPYIGPLMRKYGNMFRAADCPNMATINKVRVTDTRLLAGNSAVHSDMLMWHPEDPVEHAALQILDILFAVPQISVRLEEIPQEHKDMIAFWIKYWNANRDVLLKGDFRPQMPDQLYPIISSVGKEKAITAIYSDFVVHTEAFKDLRSFDVINAQNQTKVVLFNDQEMGKYRVEVSDCMGEKVYSKTIELHSGCASFDVPPAGLITFEQID